MNEQTMIPFSAPEWFAYFVERSGLSDLFWFVQRDVIVASVDEIDGSSRPCNSRSQFDFSTHNSIVQTRRVK